MKPWEVEEAKEPSRQVQLEEELRMTEEERKERERRRDLASTAHATWTFILLLVIMRLREAAVELVGRMEGKSKLSYDELARGAETRLKYYEVFVAVERLERVFKEALEWRKVGGGAGSAVV